jgi:UPF0716 protein FxsA
MPLFLLIFGLPLAEIAAFVIVGQWLGVFGVLGLVLASTLLGVILLRGAGGRGGLADLRSAMERRGGDAGAAMARQAFRAGAAVMLIVPGLLTSAFGLVLLIPAVQQMVVARLGARMTVVRTETRPAGDIIEGSFTELPPGHRRRDAPSPWNDQG